MIAGVVDPRGAEEARATLFRMSPSWRDVREGFGAVVARDNEPNDAIVLGETSRFEDAARVVHGGAFIALDPAGDAVVVSRGSFGGRPVFHARLGSGANVVCSRLAPILAAEPEARFRPNPDRLSSLCAGIPNPRVDASPFAGIERVAPCTTMRFRGEHAEVRVLPRTTLSPIEGRADELAEELWRRFERSVARAIGDAKSVAVTVGGGIDSSALLAAAVALSRGASARDVHTLALDFDAEGSDRPYLQALAAELGILPVRLAPRDAAEFYQSSFLLDAQPYILSIGPMERLMAKRAKELGASLILSGNFGDEILAGDLRGFAAEAAGGAPFKAACAALRLRVPWDSTPRERFEGYGVRPLLKPFVPTCLMEDNGRTQDEQIYPWAGPRMRDVLRELRRQGATKLAPRTPTQRFEHFTRADIYADCSDWRAQMESMTGVIRKDPYADEDVMDFTARVRPTTLSHGDLYRGLFRLSIRGRVPAKIVHRMDKCAFEPAFSEVAEAAGGFETLGDLWTPRALERLGVVDAAHFRASMAPLFREPSSTPVSAILWSLATQVLSCELFARTYGEDLT